MCVFPYLHCATSIIIIKMYSQENLKLTVLFYFQTTSIYIHTFSLSYYSVLLAFLLTFFFNPFKTKNERSCLNNLCQNAGPAERGEEARLVSHELLSAGGSLQDQPGPHSNGPETFGKQTGVSSQLYEQKLAVVVVHYHYERSCLSGSVSIFRNLHYRINLISLPKPSIGEVVCNIGCRVVFINYLSMKWKSADQS